MAWLLLWVHVLALAVWLGETVFFGAVIAPALFGNLGRTEAGAITALIFPGYYVVGYVCGLVLLLTAAALWQRSRPGGGVWLLAAGVATVMLGACLFAGLDLLPQAEALRPRLAEAAADDPVRREFDELHQLSVQLNYVVLIGNLVLAGLLAAQVSSGLAPRRRLSRYSSDPLL